MSGFGIFAPDGTLLATHEHVEQATLAARTRHAGRVGWIERLSDGALIGAPGGLKNLKRPKQAILPLPEPATLQEHPDPLPAFVEPPVAEEPDPRALLDELRAVQERGEPLHPWDREFFSAFNEEIGLGLPGQEALGVAFYDTEQNEGPRPADIQYGGPFEGDEAAPSVEPPTDEARVLAALSVDQQRTRAEVAQLAGLEEETAGWVLMRLLDAGRVRWARATWALPP